jgi:hypothetical protein
LGCHRKFKLGIKRIIIPRRAALLYGLVFYRQKKRVV